MDHADSDAEGDAGKEEGRRRWFRDRGCCTFDVGEQLKVENPVSISTSSPVAGSSILLGAPLHEFAFF